MRLWWIGLGAFAFACGDGAPGLLAGGARNAVLVTIDTTRLDALSVHGCELATTPALDRLAGESLRYEWCRTVAPITAPAHASMMTGLYPPRHGLRDNGYGALPASAVTVAERAQDAGLDTAAFVAALVLDRELGLDQGFARYDQPERPEAKKSGHYAERPAGEVVDAALAWLGNRPDPQRRFFMWLHVFDPHAPWDPAPAFAQLTAPAGARAPYLGDVAAMDRELGRLFDSLRERGHLANTALVVVADHGEDLGDHGEPNHSAYVYDTVVRVPFFVRYPDGFRSGDVSDEVVSVVDVGPTLCAALGLEDLTGSDGASLWRRDAPAGRGVYFESFVGYLNYGWAPLAGWADAEGKYIHGATPELYAPRADPLERDDLAGESARLARYGKGFRELVRELGVRPALEREDGAGASGALLEDLAALGYATAAPRVTELPSPLEETGRPAAATRLREYQDYLEAVRLMEERDLRPAVGLLDGVVLGNPRHVAALDKLGLCFVLVEGWPEAIEILEQRQAIAEGPGATHVNLAVAYEKTGRLEEARTALERALALSPASATARTNLERVRAKLRSPAPSSSLLDQE